jgi:hypothetical protein
MNLSLYNADFFVGLENLLGGLGIIAGEVILLDAGELPTRR